MDNKLESRIARLEKLMKKNESLEGDIFDNLEEIFDDHFCNNDDWAPRKLKAQMQAAARGDNNRLIGLAMKYLEDEYGYDPEVLENLRDEIVDDISELASDCLDNLDDWEMSDDGDDDMRGYNPMDFEGKCRNCESNNNENKADKKLEARIARLEKLLSDKSAKIKTTHI